jgi:hypothetical protein
LVLAAAVEETLMVMVHLEEIQIHLLLQQTVAVVEQALLEVALEDLVAEVLLT